MWQATKFPSALEQPDLVSSPATITPFADAASVVLAPIEGMDLVATVLLGVGLCLGPDFALAPAGLVSNDGIRPGYALESVVGQLITPDAQWLKDRRENLAADAPLQVRALVLLPFLAAGLLVNRLLLVALEDQGFVISLGIISCFGGGLLEVIRQPLPTRAERDLKAKLAVSPARLQPLLVVLNGSRSGRVSSDAPPFRISLPRGVRLAVGAGRVHGVFGRAARGRHERALPRARGGRCLPLLLPAVPQPRHVALYRWRERARRRHLRSRARLERSDGEAGCEDLLGILERNQGGGAPAE